MRATALIAAAALSFGTAAFAQHNDRDQAVRHDDANARAEQHDHGHAGKKMNSGLHRLAEKTRHAFHRMGEKMHTARNEHANDTHAMGASGESHDRDRQARMDEAYSHWQARHHDSSASR
jgi:hypothetical protein